jgi:hypothetical protein
MSDETHLETMDYYTVTLPTVKLPKPVLWALLYLLIGFGIGYFGHNLTMLQERPARVTPATETLADFVAREAQSLTADDRRKLIAVTEKILTNDFDTPSALREEFYYQRLKSGLHDSPGFNTFWDKVAEAVARSASKGEDSVESMREVYRELLRGLSSFSGEPVEGFLQSSPSIIDKASTTADADEPVSPDIDQNHNQSRNRKIAIIRRR